MLKNKFMFVLLLMVLLLMSGTSSSIAADTQVFPDDGLKNTKIEWFHTRHLFSGSNTTEDLNVIKVKELHGVISKILDEGKMPVGAVNSWSFPKFANAPQMHGRTTHLGLPVVKKDMIPHFTDSEYKRLVETRAQMYESIATEFPEIDTWLIGYEGNYFFKDTEGEDLNLDFYITFLLDTLESANQSIKKANPDAVVVAHFLGRWGAPLVISGKNVQPSEIIAEIDKKIADRGEMDSSYFDQMITDLVPSLADDREEDTYSAIYGSRSVGWNTKWSETFPVNVNPDYSSITTHPMYDWEDVRSSLTDMLNVGVTNGKAICLLGDGNNEKVGAGAKTDGVTVVPSAAEFDDDFTEKDKWTAVMDFYPIDKTNGDTFEHAGVFIRVNDRSWTNSNPDQTRFGTIVFSNESSKFHLQFTGDCEDNAGKGCTWTPEYTLNEQPFDDDGSTKWRLQIHERKVIQIDYSYELQWKGEIWKFGDANEKGSSSWINASTVEETWTSPPKDGVGIPGLNGSGYLFGLIGEDGANGQMNVEYAATAWWEYN